jgi:hypothetical protein
MSLQKVNDKEEVYGSELKVIIYMFVYLCMCMNIECVEGNIGGEEGEEEFEVVGLE